MKSSEIRKKSADELKNVLGDLRKRQFDLRMQLGTGQLASPHQLREVRRDIARVKTVLNNFQDERA
jgi:large subunit ribosomal protein L29